MGEMAEYIKSHLVLWTSLLGFSDGTETASLVLFGEKMELMEIFRSCERWTKTCEEGKGWSFYTLYTAVGHFSSDGASLKQISFFFQGRNIAELSGCFFLI